MVAAPAAVCAAFFGLTSLHSRGRAAPERIVITGSSTIAPLVSEMARRFEHRHPDLRIDVQAGGSSRGLADTRQGLAQIGMVSRDPLAHEEALQWHPLARDGVCLIVHRDNPIDGLSDEQVRGIYTGRLTRWDEVGGERAPITAVTKAVPRSKYLNPTSA
jgi:phosphate transport system substrate-binding protein